MVPDHQLKADGLKMSYHFAKNLPLRIIMTMEQITETDDAVRFCLLNQFNKDFKVFFAGFGGNGDTGFSEMVHFTQMQICQQQRRFFLPIDRFLRKQFELLTRYFHLHIRQEILFRSETQVYFKTLTVKPLNPTSSPIPKKVNIPIIWLQGIPVRLRPN